MASLQRSDEGPPELDVTDETAGGGDEGMPSSRVCVERSEGLRRLLSTWSLRGREGLGSRAAAPGIPDQFGWLRSLWRFLARDAAAKRVSDECKGKSERTCFGIHRRVLVALLFARFSSYVAFGRLSEGEGGRAGERRPRHLRWTGLVVGGMQASEETLLAVVRASAGAVTVPAHLT